MLDMNFNNADQNTGDLIPDKTKAKIIMTVRPGGVGAGGWFTQSKSSPSIMLDCEFTVMNGQFAKRKFWQYLVTEGNETAVNISRQNIRSIIESSKGIDPSDYSEAATKARQLNDIAELNNVEFAGTIKIDKAKPGSGFDDQNRLKNIITPNSKDYKSVMDGSYVNANAKPSTQPAAWTETKTANPTPFAEPQAPVNNVPAWAQAQA